MSTISAVSSALPFVLVLLVAVKDILCTDLSQSHTRLNPYNSSWQTLGSPQQQNKPFWFNQPLTTTTPWPALGQRRRLNPVNPPWVRPQISSTNPPPAWVRIPPQNSASGSEIRNQPSQQQFADFQAPSGTDATDAELREFSEELIKRDVNNAARHVEVRFQGKTSSRSMKDEAPQPLLSIRATAYDIPTIAKFVKLHDNYILDTTRGEDYTNQERVEENDFINAVVSTPVMQMTRNYLIKKGKIGSDPGAFKDKLYEIWFNLYPRGGGQISSSGFEHVFAAEVKRGTVSGLHNWIYFHEEEAKKNANYLGYLHKIEFGDKGAIVKQHFIFNGIDKPVGSMFIGTSPEFEMALYTTCFLIRPDGICPLKLGGNKFIIRTFSFHYKRKSMIGSAFPEI